MIELFMAEPAEVGAAARAGHFVASVDFFAGRLATRALGHLVHHAVHFESRFAVLTALPSVPCKATLKAHRLSALAVRTLRAAAKPRLRHCLAAVRLGTPLKLAVAPDSHILLDVLVQLRCLNRAKLLDLELAEYFGTLVLHARQLHGFAAVYPHREVVSVAVKAELMPALQGEEVFAKVAEVAAVAHFTALVHRVRTHVVELVGLSTIND